MSPLSFTMITLALLQWERPTHFCRLDCRSSAFAFHFSQLTAN